MSRPRPLYGSRPLADWVRAGGRPGRPVAAHALRLAWHAYWFEQNWRTATRRLAGQPLPDDPVFILGFWRSGTTVLHELIAAATAWNTPRTWQCFHPSTCFLTGPPSREAAADRPMDRGRIATFGPQEDEFALLLLGEPSAYRGFIDPRRLAECARIVSECAQTAAEPRVDELPRWQAFLRGIAARPSGAASGTAASGAAGPDADASDAPAPSAPVLLKSPGHTFRLPLLRTRFPRARFVWIGRDSGEVLASNARMWRAMMARYALWDEPSGALERFLHEVLASCAALLERCLEEVPPERLLWIDFADLRTEPKRQLERALRFLDPALARDPALLEQRLTRALAQVPVHAGERASPPDDARARAMDRAMSVARERFGRAS